MSEDEGERRQERDERRDEREYSSVQEYKTNRQDRRRDILLE